MKTVLITFHLLGIFACVISIIGYWESNPKAASWAGIAMMWCLNSIFNLLQREDL